MTRRSKLWYNQWSPGRTSSQIHKHTGRRVLIQQTAFCIEVCEYIEKNNLNTQITVCKWWTI